MFIYLYIYIFLYLYICVCVCVCVYDNLTIALRIWLKIGRYDIQVRESNLG